MLLVFTVYKAKFVDDYHSQRQSVQYKSHLLSVCHYVRVQSGRDCILIKHINAPKPQQQINVYLYPCLTAIKVQRRWAGSHRKEGQA